MRYCILPSAEQHRHHSGHFWSVWSVASSQSTLFSVGCSTECRIFMHVPFHHDHHHHWSPLITTVITILIMLIMLIIYTHHTRCSRRRRPVIVMVIIGVIPSFSSSFTNVTMHRCCREACATSLYPATETSVSNSCGQDVKHMPQTHFHRDIGDGAISSPSWTKASTTSFLS